MSVNAGAGTIKTTLEVISFAEGNDPAVGTAFATCPGQKQYRARRKRRARMAGKRERAPELMRGSSNKKWHARRERLRTREGSQARTRARAYARLF